MGGKILADGDAVGLKFGKLTVVSRHGVDSRNHTLWLCDCECGKKTISEMNPLKTGKKKSCGCLRRTNTASVIHGACRNEASDAIKRTFDIWVGMRKRCNNENDHAYKWYGAKGIKVCGDWGTFNQFVTDMGVAPEGMTIERTNVEYGYSKDNCTWIPLKQQSENKTTTLWVVHDGIRWCLKALCKHLGLSYMRVYKRYRVRGWTLERSIQS